MKHIISLDSVSCKTNLPRPEHEVEAEIAALCSQLAQRAGLDMATQIESVGIGTPGSVNPHTGVVEFNANFGYRNWPLVSAMEKLLPCRVYIENDANAAAYGEYIAGAAQGAKYAIAVTLGTGIGGGIIIDGKIFSGFNSAGAEIGHTVIVKGGRPCMCGRRGCWEKYASARALAEDTLAAMGQHKDNIMWSYVHGDPARVNAKTAFDAMRAGDALGTQGGAELCGIRCLRPDEPDQYLSAGDHLHRRRRIQGRRYASCARAGGSGPGRLRPRGHAAYENRHCKAAQ